MPSSGDEHESDNPPWYAPDRPGGRFNASGVPDRLFQHPVIQQRKIHLSHAVQPGVVFFTLVAPAPALLGNQVVKILHTDKEEMAIYERLLPDLHRPNNHTIPGEITRNGHPLLIMPRLNNINNLYKRERWTPRRLMDAILQVVEGVEYLHSKRIAHMDLHSDNLVVGTRQTAAEHQRVVETRIYIIDFDQSRQFTLGPGIQSAITLPDTVYAPPNGLTSFDPYSWDVYCMGRTLEHVVKDVYRSGEAPHWIAQKYIRWLIGDERLGGCVGVCRCRPTARMALRVLVVLRWAVCAAEGYRWVTITRCHHVTGFLSHLLQCKIHLVCPDSQHLGTVGGGGRPSARRWLSAAGCRLLTPHTPPRNGGGPTPCEDMQSPDPFGCHLQAL